MCLTGQLKVSDFSECKGFFLIHNKTEIVHPDECSESYLQLLISKVITLICIMHSNVITLVRTGQGRCSSAGRAED